MESRHSRDAKLHPSLTAPGRVLCSVFLALLALAVLPALDARAGSIPMPGTPECVSGCSSSSGSGGGSGNSSSESGGSSGGIFNLIDRIQEHFEAAAAARRAEGHKQNEQGVVEFNRGNYAEALRLFRLAEGNDPDNAVIRQNVKNAETEVARIEGEKKRQAELQREQTEYRKRMEKLAALMPRPKLPTDPGQAKRMVRPAVPLPGFSTAQWQEYLDAKEEVERLYTKLNKSGVLSDTDAQAFYAALRRRNALWDQAMAQPLGAAERERLRLPLPVVESRERPSLSAAVQQLVSGGKATTATPPDRRTGTDAKTSPDAITTAFVADFSADKGTKLVEETVGEAVGEARGQQWADRFEHLLSVGRIAVKAREGGAPAAGAETADLVISKIPEPMSNRAELAVEGGRLYSKVAYRALNRFMEDAMKATGATFDAEAFWKHFDETLTQSQKGEKQWIQFGE